MVSLRVRRPVLGALGCVVAACAALAGCSSSSSTASSAPGKQLTTVNIVFGPFAGDAFPMYVAQSAGLFQKYGLDVKMTTAQTTVQYTELASGAANLAWGSTNVLETAAKTGGAVQVIGNAGKNATEMLVAPNIKSVADLSGQKVGASAPGSNGDIGVKAYLSLYNLQAGKNYTMEYFSGQFAAANTALAQEQIQGLYDQPPYLFQTLQANPKLHSIGRIDESAIGSATANVISVNTAWAKANPSAVSDFVKAWRAAIALSKSDKAVAVKAIETGAKVNASMASQWYDLQAQNNELGPLTQSAFNVIIQQLSSTYPGLQSTAKYSELVDNSFAS